MADQPISLNLTVERPKVLVRDLTMNRLPPPRKYDKEFLKKEEEYLKKKGGKGDVDGTLDKKEVKTLYGEQASKDFDKYANKENTKGVKLIDVTGLQKMKLNGFA